MNLFIQLGLRVVIAASVSSRKLSELCLLRGGVTKAGRGLLALCSLALCSTLHAVSPAPDGGYANGNTAEGSNALFSLTSGVKNSADGYLALYFDTTGRYNTASGAQALYNNTTGVANTANGMNALFSNTGGGDNTAIGFGALYSPRLHH